MKNEERKALEEIVGQNEDDIKEKRRSGKMCMTLLRG